MCVVVNKAIGIFRFNFIVFLVFACFSTMAMMFFDFLD